MKRESQDDAVTRCYLYLQRGSEPSICLQQTPVRQFIHIHPPSGHHDIVFLSLRRVGQRSHLVHHGTVEFHQQISTLNRNST